MDTKIWYFIITSSLKENKNCPNYPLDDLYNKLIASVSGVQLHSFQFLFIQFLHIFRYNNTECPTAEDKTRLSIMNVHCLLHSKSNAKSEHWMIFKTHPEEISSQNSLALFVHICQVQCVCSDAFNAGWGESRWPFDGSSIGTNGLQGVRLIRLLYCAVMIACQI